VCPAPIEGYSRIGERILDRIRVLAGVDDILGYAEENSMLAASKVLLDLMQDPNLLADVMGSYPPVQSLLASAAALSEQSEGIAKKQGSRLVLGNSLDKFASFEAMLDGPVHLGRERLISTLSEQFERLVSSSLDLDSKPFLTGSAVLSFDGAPSLTDLQDRMFVG